MNCFKWKTYYFVKFYFQLKLKSCAHLWIINLIMLTVKQLAYIYNVNRTVNGVIYHKGQGDNSWSFWQCSAHSLTLTLESFTCSGDHSWHTCTHHPIVSGTFPDTCTPHPCISKHCYVSASKYLPVQPVVLWVWCCREGSRAETLSELRYSEVCQQRPPAWLEARAYAAQSASIAADSLASAEKS